MKKKTKQSKKIKEKKFFLYVVYEADRVPGKIEEEDEYEYLHIGLEVFGICRKDPDRIYQEKIEVPEDICHANVVYLVVVRYRDGGTFRSTTGHYEFVDIVYTPGEAIDMRYEIEEDKFSARKFREGYLPWKGCFAKLEKVEIHEFKVTDDFFPYKEKNIITHVN